MNIIGAVVMVFVGLAGPAHSESGSALYFTPTSTSLIADEGHLVAWMKAQKRIQRKLAKAVKNIEVPSDLRDAVGTQPDLAVLPKKAAEASPAMRRELLARLPGMSPTPFESCRTLESCPEASMLLHVENSVSVEDTVAAIVRPWILLQKAKGKEFRVIANEGAGDQILKLQLQGLEDAALEVHVSPSKVGGINVWLRGAHDPMALYVQQRHAALTETAPAK